jgi:hypothetical protein
MTFSIVDNLTALYSYFMTHIWPAVSTRRGRRRINTWLFTAPQRGRRTRRNPALTYALLVGGYVVRVGILSIPTACVVVAVYLIARAF